MRIAVRYLQPGESRPGRRRNGLTGNIAIPCSGRYSWKDSDSSVLVASPSKVFNNKVLTWLPSCSLNCNESIGTLVLAIKNLASLKQLDLRQVLEEICSTLIQSDISFCNISSIHHALIPLHQAIGLNPVDLHTYKKPKIIVQSDCLVLQPDRIGRIWSDGIGASSEEPRPNRKTLAEVCAHLSLSGGKCLDFNTRNLALTVVGLIWCIVAAMCQVLMADQASSITELRRAGSSKQNFTSTKFEIKFLAANLRLATLGQLHWHRR